MVSVIVPNYNHALYLRQRIESILNQTFQDFELILLDDCSTDNSRDVLSLYKGHPKVSNIVFNDTNSGSTFKQWSKGIELANGEYIWIAESDDWAEDTLLEKLVDQLGKHSSAGIAYCNSNYYYGNQCESDSATFKNNKFKTDKWSNSYFEKGLREIEYAFLWDCTINNVSSVLFRKEVLASVLPFEHPFRYAGDWFCYICITASSDIAYIADSLNNYRYHESNVSKKAGYNYIIELFHIYNWLLTSNLINNNILYQSFNACLSDFHASGVRSNAIKDLIYLRPINKKLYHLLTRKKIKRILKIVYFNLSTIFIWQELAF